MRERFGIDVTHDGARGVLVRDGVVVWHDEMPLSADTAIGETVAALLSHAPVRRARGRIAGVALGAQRSQTKQLVGVPPVANEQALRTLLRENASAFFVHCWRDVAVGAVERRPDGTCWATVYDAAVAQEIVTAVRNGFAARIAVTSPIVAVARVLPPGEHHCTIDSVPYRISTIEGCTIAALMPSLDALAIAEPHAPASLDALGDRASDFAVAYGAALLARDRALAWRDQARDALETRRRRSGLRAAALVLAIASGWAYAAPGLRAAWLLRGSASAASALQQRDIGAARAASELQRANLQLTEIGRFQATRGAVPALIGDLTRSLPESTAIVSLRIDSLYGTMTVITPHVPDLLPQLASLRNLVSARLVGSITRESAANARMERAAIRFDRPRPPTKNARSIDPRGRSAR